MISQRGLKTEEVFSNEQTSAGPGQVSADAGTDDKARWGREALAKAFPQFSG